MFKFNQQFFERNQTKLLKIANSFWLRWLLGLNRLPKEIKGLKIDRITPNSVHHNLEIKLTKNGRYKKQKVQAYFFSSPRFAEALAFNLSPIAYFQMPKRPVWRFSPIGLAYQLFLGFFGYKFFGLPILWFGTVTNYLASIGAGFVAVHSSNNWDTSHDATDGDESSYSAASCSVSVNRWDNLYEIYRAFLPFDTSGLPDTATISAAALKIYIASKRDDDNDGNDFIGMVQTSQASNTALANADFDQCGAVNSPTEGMTRVDIGDITTSAWTDWALNATALGWISKTDYTKLGLREGHDIVDDPYTTTNSQINTIAFRSVGYTGTDYDPYLAVTYTTSTITTKKITSRARVKIIGITKKETIRSRIKKISNKLITGRTRIKVAGVTKKETSRARIKILGINKKIQIKGRILKAGNTKKETSRARILTAGIDKKIQIRSRIKTTGDKATTARAMIEKTPKSTLSARSRIFNTINKKATARGRIKRTEDKSTQSKARIKRIESAINQLRARVKQTGVEYKVASKARIKKLGVEEKITSRARIKQTGSRKATMKARIFFNRTKTISGRGRIKTAGVTYKQTSRGRIKNTSASRILSRGRIVIARTSKTTARAKIKKTGTVKSITSRARMKKTISAGALTGRAKIRAKSTFKPLGNIRKQSPLGRVSKNIPSGR